MDLRVMVNLTWSMKISRTSSACSWVLPGSEALGQPLPPKDSICTRSEAPGVPHHLTCPLALAGPTPPPHSAARPHPPSVPHLRTFARAAPSARRALPPSPRALLNATQSPSYPL